MLNTEYGHVKANFNGMTFNLSPTLEAISLIGEKEDIMNVFSKLHCMEVNNYISMFERHSQSTIDMLTKYSKKVTGPQQLSAAHLVLTCCSKDDLSPMIGKFIVKDRVYYQNGFAPVQNVIELAKHMLYHGMIGHTEDRVISKRSGSSSSFTPSDYAELARLKLNMSRDDAWALTMTEFVSMWNKEYPPSEKDIDDTITQEEYDDSVSRLEKIRDAALARSNK